MLEGCHWPTETSAIENMARDKLLEGMMKSFIKENEPNRVWYQRFQRSTQEGKECKLNRETLVWAALHIAKELKSLEDLSQYWDSEFRNYVTKNTYMLKGCHWPSQTDEIRNMPQDKLLEGMMKSFIKENEPNQVWYYRLYRSTQEGKEC